MKAHDPLADLDQAFESLAVEPLSDDDLGRVSGGTLGVECSTANAACEPTHPVSWTCSGSGCEPLPTTLFPGC